MLKSFIGLKSNVDFVYWLQKHVLRSFSGSKNMCWGRLLTPKTRVEVAWWLQKHVVGLFIRAKTMCWDGLLVPLETCWGGLLAPGDREATVA